MDTSQMGIGSANRGAHGVGKNFGLFVSCCLVFFREGPGKRWLEGCHDGNGIHFLLEKKGWSRSFTFFYYYYILLLVIFFWVFRRVVSNVCHQFLTSKYQVQTQPEQLRQGGGIWILEHLLKQLERTSMIMFEWVHFNLPYIYWNCWMYIRICRAFSWISNNSNYQQISVNSPLRFH